MAARCAGALDRLRALVAPCVTAAVLRTMWNGWSTRRRFQQGWAPCVLGCSSPHDDVQDSIEHYAHCPIILDMSRRYLNVPPLIGAARKGGFIVLGLQAGQISDDTLARRAVLAYAAYRTVHTLRERCRLPPLDQARLAGEMLRQMAREAARHHPGTVRLLDAAWR